VPKLTSCFTRAVDYARTIHVGNRRKPETRVIHIEVALIPDQRTSANTSDHGFRNRRRGLRLLSVEVFVRGVVVGLKCVNLDIQNSGAEITTFVGILANVGATH
jgi:hypothetical protein